MSMQTDTLPQELTAFIENFNQVPAGYGLSNARQVTQDGQPYWLVRFERINGQNTGLGGEHFSMVVDAAQSRLMGLTWLDQSQTATRLPSNKIAHTFAQEFLQTYAPDLYTQVELLWIAQHDEIIQVANQALRVSGTKVKMRQTDGRYTWVILNNNEQVMTFERDIVWNFDMSKRTTEKWLHDYWIKLRQ